MDGQTISYNSTYHNTYVDDLIPHTGDCQFWGTSCIYNSTCCCCNCKSSSNLIDILKGILEVEEDPVVIASKFKKIIDILYDKTGE